MKKLTIIHTTMATLQTIPNMIQEQYHDAFAIVNVLDDSMLNEIKTKGEISNAVKERFVQYALIAQHHGSDAILLACSSIGEGADVARELLSIPVLKIDDPLSDLTVEKGDRILVLGTVSSTLLPTSSLIRKKMKHSNQSVTCKLIPDVFELYAVDRNAHDQKIAKAIMEHQDEFDVIVLAQASMSNAVSYVSQGSEKVLTSLPLGLTQLAQLLK